MYNSPYYTVPTQPGLSSLGSLILTATAGASSDTVQLYTGDGNIYASSSSSSINLSNNWTEAEFNIFGDGSGATAQFNYGGTIAVQVLTNGFNMAPKCPNAGTTGELNSLYLVPGSCCMLAGATPGIFFTESYSTSTPAYPCPSNPQPYFDEWLAATQHIGAQQTDLFTIGNEFALTVTSSLTNEPWSLPVTISPGVFDREAPLAASHQFGINQTDVFAVDVNGNVNVSWSFGNGPWGALPHCNVGPVSQTDQYCSISAGRDYAN
jgi:hypothetical protein